MAAFRALMLREEGGKVVPRLETVDEDRLPAGEVTVAIECSTLNYKDAMVLQGQGRLVRDYPHIPGIDFAGTVERSDSPEFEPGDPVVLTGWRVGETHWGGYAEKARVKADWLVRRPQELGAVQAMAIGTAGLTAMLALLALERHGLRARRRRGAGHRRRRGRRQRGDRVALGAGAPGRRRDRPARAARIPDQPRRRRSDRARRPRRQSVAAARPRALGGCGRRGRRHHPGDDPDPAPIPRQRRRLRSRRRQRSAGDGDPVPAARGQSARDRTR